AMGLGAARRRRRGSSPPPRRRQISSREPVRVVDRSGEGRLVELERIALRVPQEAERAIRRPDDLLVPDARAVESADRELQVVDDQLRHDTAASVVLRLRGGRPAGDQREARALRRVEPDERPRPVQKPQADDVAVELQLRFRVLDEDQGAADLAHVPERLDHRHRRTSWRWPDEPDGTTAGLPGAAPWGGTPRPQPSSRRTTGKRASSTATAKPAATQNSGVAALVASGRVSRSG